MVLSGIPNPRCLPYLDFSWQGNLHRRLVSSGVSDFDNMADDKCYGVHFERSTQPGVTPVEVATNYSEWSKTYDTDVSQVYRGAEIATEEVLNRIPEDKRQHLKIMDIAAGTGRVGLILKEKGFRNFDALEPSEGMMNKLKATGIYSKTYLEFVGVGQNSIPDDTYDLVIVAGGMLQGHIPVKGIDDMARIAKPGGLVIISMRKAFLQDVAEYKDRLVPHIDLLEKQGKWSKVEVKTVPNYSTGNEGIIFTYKVL